MIAPSRREVLFGGLLTVFYTAGCPGACFAQTQTLTGCAVPHDQVQDFFSRTTSVQSFQSGGEAIEPRSGNPQLDRALAQSLGMLSRMFEVLPGFAYYRETEGPNARATSQVLLERTDGTVLFGLQFLQMLLSRPAHGDASVVAVCAHEFGHIVSYKRGLIGQLSPNPAQPFRAEQFADFMAGYFGGRRKLERPDFPAVVFATTQRDFGGQTRGSHGTSQERGSAVEAGFLSAYQQRHDINAAVQAGFQYAMSR